MVADFTEAGFHGRGFGGFYGHGFHGGGFHPGFGGFYYPYYGCYDYGQPPFSQTWYYLLRPSGLLPPSATPAGRRFPLADL